MSEDREYVEVHSPNIPLEKLERQRKLTLGTIKALHAQGVHRDDRISLGVSLIVDALMDFPPDERKSAYAQIGQAVSDGVQAVQLAAQVDREGGSARG